MAAEPQVSVREGVDLAGVARQLGTTGDLVRQLVCSAVFAALRQRPLRPPLELAAYDSLQRRGRNHIRIVSADDSRPAIAVHLKRKVGRKPAIPEIRVTAVELE